MREQLIAKAHCSTMRALGLIVATMSPTMSKTAHCSSTELIMSPPHSRLFAILASSLAPKARIRSRRRAGLVWSPHHNPHVAMSAQGATIEAAEASDDPGAASDVLPARRHARRITGTTLDSSSMKASWWRPLMGRTPSRERRGLCQEPDTALGCEPKI